MSRSVVLAGTIRCDHCLMPPRWCLCSAMPPARAPIPVDVLMDHREQWRPSSTGRLIERALRGARRHVFAQNRPPPPETVLRPEHEPWIIHPLGEPPPPIPAAVPPQILLLDGSWAESGRMYRAIESWGRPIRLPLAGASRYWLRAQQGDGRYSTIEALIGVLKILGFREVADQLTVHFELLVYATLQARGQKGPAAEYLAGSPVREALPEFLARLHRRRPQTSSLQVPPLPQDPLHRQQAQDHQVIERRRPQIDGEP